MPRQRKKTSYKEDSEDEEESEWEEEEGEQPSSEDANFDEEESDEAEAPPPKNRKTETPKKGPTKSPVKKISQASPAKKAKIEYDDIDSDEEELPSYARLTDRGGYAHKKSSRLKISRANRGNVPWNKGKNRSTTTKASISAGVRARNREVLRKKLEKLGMTEEEYNAKMKEIKYVRERLRRARKANRDRQAATEKESAKAKRQQEEVEVVEEIQFVYDKEEETEDDQEENVDKDTESADDAKIAAIDDDIEAEEKDPNVSNAKGDANTDNEKDQPVHPMLSMFARDLHWTPHPFDKEQGAASFDNICPYGGPGGLICCEACTATYSKYLSSTFCDIEEQRTSKVAREVTQLVSFMDAAKKQLGASIRAARKKPPPISRKRAGAAADGTVALLNNQK